MKNISAKYIYPYIESLFDRDCKTSYIRTEMAAIRHYHSLTHSKNILPSNKDLGTVSYTHLDVYKRQILEFESEDKNV